MVLHGRIWPDVLKICRYFQDNPNPGVYSRELPVSVHTKFIDENKATIDSVLQHLFPTKASGKMAESFEQRYGLLFEEPLVRLRMLDKDLRGALGLIATDISIPMSEACDLNWTERLVIVTENKMNFLTLPPLPNTIGIWGGGSAAQMLSSISWLNKCRLLYWGDIDVHGFHMVSRLRGAFPHLETIMMDSQTLDDHALFLVAAAKTRYEQIVILTAEEHAAYVRVKASQLLLEQEKIPHSYAVARLAAVVFA